MNVRSAMKDESKKLKDHVSKESDQTRKEICQNNAQTRIYLSQMHKEMREEQNKMQARIAAQINQLESSLVKRMDESAKKERVVMNNAEAAVSCKKKLVFPDVVSTTDSVTSDITEPTQPATELLSMGTPARRVSARQAKQAALKKQLAEEQMDNKRLSLKVKDQSEKLSSFKLPSKDPSRVIPKAQEMNARGADAALKHQDRQALGRINGQRKKANNPLKG